MAHAAEKKAPAPVKGSRKDDFKRIAGILEDSMANLPNGEKERRVSAFESRVAAATSRRAKSS